LKLVILDRDGVINRDSPDYVKSPDEWQPYPGSLEAISRLHRNHYRVIVATNQSGISRNLFDLSMLHRIHQKMITMVNEKGGQIDAVFFCPHRPEDLCLCRIVAWVCHWPASPSSATKQAISPLRAQLTPYRYSSSAPALPTHGKRATRRP